MKISVLIKCVPDTSAVPEIKPNGIGVETSHVDVVLNPYDEFAVEEAVRWKELYGAEVTAVSLGGEPARKALRTAFAMGVDHGILVPLPAKTELTGRGAARCLAAVLQRLSPDLIVAGKQAVDDDGAQVAERIAEILGYAHASAVTRLSREGERLVVDREIEGGNLVVELPLPAVVTAEKGLNTPRYPTLPQVLKAKRKEIQEIDPGPEMPPPGWQVEALALPKAERKRQLFRGTAEAQVEQLCKELQTVLQGGFV